MKNKICMQLSKIEYVTCEMALKLYTQGCRVKCPGCNNKDMWDFKTGKLNLDELGDRIEKYSIAIKRIYITGGEPLNQEIAEVVKLLRFLKTFNKEIWLFTSFNMYEIYPGIFEYVDFIKTGIHDPLSGPGKIIHGVKLSSANQRIWEKGVNY